MKIEIWSDVACPWCYVGKRRFEQAIARFPHRDNLEVTWRSYELDPGAPARRDVPLVEHLAAKYRVPVAQAEAMNARLAGEARKEGLELRLDRVVLGNTFDAHRVIHLAATLGLRAESVERLFRAYFVDGASLGDHEALVTLATEIGLPAERVRTMLASDEFAAAVRADEARARGFGIGGVPFFAIDERYGVSGAQPPEAILGALTQAWEESHPLKVLTPAGDADADECTDESCAI
jgi:predicted DsbA family dithiol-disulfide isomerase